MTRRIVLVLLGLGVGACRGEAPKSPDAGFDALVQRLRPDVERAVGLKFKEAPRSALRTREQVRAFVVSQMAKQLPPERIRGAELTYKLLGLLPDTLNLTRTLQELLTSQILGFYDPETRTLYGVVGADTTQTRLMAAHELVHALQDQYIPLDSILNDDHDSDRLAGAQAILEGQANYASLAMSLGQRTVSDPAYWERYAELTRTDRAALGSLADAPLILRERLLFPYREGGAFMAWWERSQFHDTLPYGPRMPASSEQVLHPDRYADGDAPIVVRFASGPPPLLEDNLGEIEMRILTDQLAGLAESPDAPPLGWGGDRFRLYDVAPAGALVWYTAWDTERDAERFRNSTGRRLIARSRAGYRTAVDSITIGGRPGVRVVIAPEGWALRRDPPSAEAGGR